MSWVIHHIRQVRRLHAKLGVAAMLYLVFLVFSGWALNHAADLKLDQIEIGSPWLMRWYGISNATPETGFLTDNTHLAWVGNKWAVSKQVMTQQDEQPLGAVETAGVLYIATPRSLSLLQADGQLLDKLDSASLPATPITALGKVGQQIVIKTPYGIFVTEDGLNWEKRGATNVLWSVSQTLPDSVKQRLQHDLAPSLSVQRILQDIHSGRILGQYGPVFVDLVGLALLTVGLSGLWMFWRAARQARLRKTQS
jgi:uncharacterized iron-regulated membrane protein